MKNQTWAEWVADPKRAASPLIAVQVGEQGSIPVKNHVCPECNNSRVTKKLQTLMKTDLKKFEIALNHEIQKGSVHGWSAKNGIIAVYENIIYHASCLRKKLGSKNYDQNQDVIEVGFVG